MTVQQNEAIARADVEMYNSRNLEGFSQLYTPDAEFLNVPTGVTARGSQGVRQGVQTLLTAFPDSKAEIISVIAGERNAAIEYWMRGTHTGPLVTAAGTLPPTRRKVEMRLCDIFETEGGKVTSSRSYWDLYGLMNQLGLVPEAAHP